MTNPITPPPELVTSLRNSAPHGIRDAGVTRELWLINYAYAAGAYQELEACCKVLEVSDRNAREFLYAARRPKPLTPRELALASVKRFEESGEFFSDQMRELEFIRKTLEQLDD
jgi:hypothetical protein